MGQRKPPGGRQTDEAHTLKFPSVCQKGIFCGSPQQFNALGFVSSERINAQCMRNSRELHANGDAARWVAHCDLIQKNPKSVCTEGSLESALCMNLVHR